MESAATIVTGLIQAIVLLLCLAGAACFVALLKGCFVLRRMGRSVARDDTPILLKSPLVPAVSVIAVARDASLESREFVRRLVGLHFGKHEVVLVLDGASASALEVWTREFHLLRSGRTDPAFPGLGPTAQVRETYASTDPYSLVVVDKDRGGEADALNAGVREASSPWIALIGPECEFEPTVLLRVVRPVLEWPDTLGVCAGAPTLPTGGLAGQFAALESLRAWLGRFAAMAGWGLLGPIPGSTMLLKREAIAAVGGFQAGGLEMFLRLHALARAAHTSYRIALVPDAISRCRTPQSMEELRRFTMFEQWGIARALSFRASWKQGLFPLGWLLPALFCDRFMRPLLETIVYLLTAAALAAGWLDAPLAGLVLLSTVGTGILVSMAAVVFRELTEMSGSDPGRLVKMFLCVFPENLGYRQIRNFWLLAGYTRHGPEGAKQSRGR
jgi:cellulose synthase/poly-beta-1,6-N-acetylglucosamine synthase-like glycosyltransferase